ncbi:type II secretion system GspH family protein [Fructobacillus sp. W13]|uniref:Type II secretion system GspH family protein n=1 Tax=Fructobacillus apis TaxID=2935017 RepID=A0ABT0ZP89_9LACO|nr:type II secretion system protein [Fructobacillus apis]MCO0831813.1 type II secretion system GspH family protein [Fructobacillus apis]
MLKAIQHNFRNRKAAFTLVESLIVLAIVSATLFLCVTLQPKKETGMVMATFKKRFSLLYQSERLLAQEKEQMLSMTFSKNALWTEHERLVLPEGYRVRGEEVVKISASGFVSPKTILFIDDIRKKIFRLVILFGGGDYYFE